MQLELGSNPIITPKPISSREADVLACLYLGLSNAESAAKLDITVKTVKFHLTRIFKKLGTSSRTQLMALEIKRLQNLRS